VYPTRSWFCKNLLEKSAEAGRDSGSICPASTAVAIGEVWVVPRVPCYRVGKSDLAKILLETTAQAAPRLDRFALFAIDIKLGGLIDVAQHATFVG
jgi:hypothetical protein